MAFNVDVESYRSWLPPSTAASPKRVQKKKVDPELDADAKSYRSWLPPSSGPASRARLLADKASSSSSSKSPKPSQCRSATMKIFTKKGMRTTKSAFQWKRLDCEVSFKGTYRSVMGSHTFHWKTRCSELPITEIRRSAPTVVAVAYGLPVDQIAWSRPLCSANFFGPAPDTEAARRAASCVWRLHR